MEIQPYLFFNGSPRFGMVGDRFGVSWMITLPPKNIDPA